MNIAQFYVRVSRKSTTAKHSKNVQPLVCLAAHHFSVLFHCSPFHRFTALFTVCSTPLHVSTTFHNCNHSCFTVRAAEFRYSQAVAGVRSNCVLFSSDRVCTQHHSTAYQGPLTEKKVLLTANSNQLKNK